MVDIIVTEAGLAEIVNAENTGTAPVVLSAVGFGTGQYTVTAKQTALQAEFKRIGAVKGISIGDNIININLTDESDDSYKVYEIGIFTDSGTLFAVCSQNTPLLEKAAISKVSLAIDFALTNVNPESITFGDANFLLNSATTEQQGIIELATEAEAKAKTDTHRAITPATLDKVIEGHSNIVHRSGAETIEGSKTFNAIQLVGDAPYIRVSNNDVIKGTIPDSGKYWGISFSDSEGYVAKNRLSLIETSYSKNGDVVMSMGVYKPEHDNSSAMTKLSIIYPASGSPYATAPTPANGDNSMKISTTAWVTTKLKEYLPLAGGTMTGTIKVNQTVALCKTDTANAIRIDGGTDYTNGAFIALHGKDGSLKGGFEIAAVDATNRTNLIASPSGNLTWQNKNIVRSVNNVNANASGNVSITISNIPDLQTELDGKALKNHTHDYLPLSGGAMTVTQAITRNVDNSFLGFHGGTGYNNNGAQLFLCGENHSSLPGRFQLNARTSKVIKTLEGDTDGTLIWDNKYVLNNSFQMPTDTGAIMLTAGASSSGGAYFRLYGKDHTSGEGKFNLVATNGTSANTWALTGKPDGELTWGGNDVITSAGGTIYGGVYFAKPPTIMATSTDEGGEICLEGGDSWANGRIERYKNWTRMYEEGQGTNGIFEINHTEKKIYFDGKDISLGYPNYSAGVSLGSKSSYTAAGNGWLYVGVVGGNGVISVTVNNATVMSGASATAEARSCFFPVKTGDVIKVATAMGVAFNGTMIYYPNR